MSGVNGVRSDERMPLDRGCSEGHPEANVSRRISGRTDRRGEAVGAGDRPLRHDAFAFGESMANHCVSCTRRTNRCC